MRRSDYVIVVTPPDTIATVHGHYLNQARAEEDAARLRRGLKGRGFEVRVQPIQFATTEAVLRTHGLDRPAEVFVIDKIHHTLPPGTTWTESAP